MDCKEDEKKNSCSHCGKVFNRRCDLYRHLRIQHGENTKNIIGNIKADKQAKKETANSDKQAKKEQVKADKQAKKETANSDKQAKQEQVKADKHAKKETANSFNFTRDVQKGHFLCPTCHCPFLTKLKRDDHAKCHKKLKNHMCKHCMKTFANRNNKTLHEKKCISTIQTGGGIVREEFVEDESEDGDLQLHETALRNVIRSYRLSFSRNSKNLTDRLQDALHQAYEHITIEKESDEPFKVYASLQANFYKPTNANEVSNPAPNFNTEPAIVLTTTNVQDIVELFYTNLLHQVDEYERSGSGWIL